MQRDSDIYIYISMYLYMHTYIYIYVTKNSYIRTYTHAHICGLKVGTEGFSLGFVRTSTPMSMADMTPVPAGGSKVMS